LAFWKPRLRRTILLLLIPLGLVYNGLFAEEYFVGVNKIFDVIPGQISYNGRLEVDFFIFGGRQLYETRIEDKFDEDQGRFKNDCPALQNRTIVKDLIY